METPNRQAGPAWPFERAGAYTPPPWPFEEDPAKLPACYGPRLTPGYPLAQDPIGYAMTTLCAWDCELVHGPEPVFGSTLERQLDALVCDYVYTSPDTHPERIRWEDRLRRVVVDGSALAAAGLDGLTFELARLPSPSAGIVAVETIETLARFTFGGVLFEVTGLLGAPTEASFRVSPLAMPFVLAAGPPPTLLRWRWELVHELYSENVRDPLWLTAARPQQVMRGEDVLAPWTDNRYGWGSPHVRNHHIVRGGHGLVRLYCTLAFSPVQSPTAPPVASVELAGSLVGFWQSAGRDGAAVRNNTLRLV